MNIAFFGTSDRSVPILESLKKSFDLRLCVTKPDSKVGRKQVTKENGVKTWAKVNKVAYVEVENLKGENANKVLAELNRLEINFGVVADFSLIIPEQIITRFNKKLLNIHFSLLPKYRGASPVQFAILNGDKVVGVSYMLTEKSVDTGAVLAQIEYKDIDKKTAGELYKELFELAARNLPKVINDYAENKIQPKTQNEAQASYTYSPTRPKNTFTYKEDAQINWAKTAEEIERATRAYNPWPIAWTTLKELTASLNQNLRQGINPELKVKIYKARVEKTANDENKLIIEQLQVEGKNKSDWKTFENGYVA